MGNCASASIDPGHECHERAFPMWVVKVSDVMAMSGVLQPHEVLRDSGLLVEHRPGTFCIFISHQWLGRRHPDPTGAQLKVLQQALLSIGSGSLDLYVDLVQQSRHGNRFISKAEREAIVQGYLWLDWFSIPQDPGRVADLRLAVQSIPSYADACKAFVALVPELPHHDSGSICDFETWRMRGWCRCELWCAQLSNQGGLPMVAIYGPHDAEFLMSKDWVFALPDEGEFTVEEDRLAIKGILQVCLRARVSFLQKHPEELGLCRYLKARGVKYVDQARAWSLESFLAYFGFSDLQSALKTKDLAALHCASIMDEASTIRSLVEAKASVNARCKAIMKVNLMPSPPLYVSVELGNLAAIRELLTLQADPNSSAVPGLPALGVCRHPDTVDFMLQNGADVNLRPPPAKISPLALACSVSVPAEVVTRLLEGRADVNDSYGGHSKSALACAAGYSCRATPRTSLAHAKLLLDARADVNQPGCPTGLFRMLELGYRLANCCGNSRFRSRYFAESSSTPLGCAAQCGNLPLASFLLAARADPDLPNSRAHTPRHLARISGNADMLQLFENDKPVIETEQVLVEHF